MASFDSAAEYDQLLIAYEGLRQAHRPPSLLTLAGWKPIARFWRAPNALPQEVPALDRLCNRLLTYCPAKRAALRKLNEINHAYLRSRILTPWVVSLFGFAYSTFEVLPSGWFTSWSGLERDVVVQCLMAFWGIVLLFVSVAFLAPLPAYLPKLKVHEGLENAFAVVEDFEAKRLEGRGESVTACKKCQRFATAGDGWNSCD